MPSDQPVEIVLLSDAEIKHEAAMLSAHMAAYPTGFVVVTSECVSLLAGWDAIWLTVPIQIAICFSVFGLSFWLIKRWVMS